MTLSEAVQLIRHGIHPLNGTWADIGAGTGMFTLALMEILTEGKIIAVDKSPHALYKLPNPQSSINKSQSKIKNLNSKIALDIVEADFNGPLDLPPLDGIIMANSLHYAKDHLAVLKNVLSSLKPDGTFILIEYDTEKPNEPWVPNPVSFEKFKKLCQQVSLTEPMEIGRKKSIYGDGEIYVVRTKGKAISGPFQEADFQK
jgi:SAM-dependent methyltransferase